MSHEDEVKKPVSKHSGKNVEKTFSYLPCFRNTFKMHNILYTVQMLSTDC